MVKLNFFDLSLTIVKDEICFSVLENDTDLTTQERCDQESERNELDQFIHSEPVFFKAKPCAQWLSFRSDHRIESLKTSLNNPPPEFF